MADRTSTSPPKKITIDGQNYDVRTVTQWKDRGRPGTIDDSTPPVVTLQYKAEGLFSQYITIADRTGNAATNNGWSFRPLAGTGFRKELVKKGPTSLSSQLDSITQTQLAKDAVVPVTRSQQALKNVATTKTNQALAAVNQDPTAAAGGQNQGQAEADRTGDNSKPIDLTDLEKATAVDEEKTRTSFPKNLIYPIDIGSTKQDIIQFEMLQYKPKGYSAEKGLAGVGDKRDSNRSAIGRVILPIPSGISDQNGVSWGQETLNPAEALAANLALSTITRGFGAGGNVLTSAAGQIQESSDEAKTLAAAAFASAATGIGQQLLTRTTGAVVNPNLELLFREPTLRPFSFTFKMSARSNEEAKMIIKIIRFFKQGMAVQRSKSNLFLKSPHTFRIKYKYRGQNGGEHKYIGKIKECALQNFNVSYTPEGQYATFEDGVLVSYEMQMSFTELEPVFNDDYTGLDGNADTEIGY